MKSVKDMAKIAYDALEEKKADDIKVINIGGVSSLADYFIIASGSSVAQMETLVESVKKSLGKAGYEHLRIEGTKSTSWTLIDYGDIIVHIFSDQDRLFYDLERMWSGGEQISFN